LLLRAGCLAVLFQRDGSRVTQRVVTPMNQRGPASKAPGMAGLLARGPVA